jgi:hypothetical protein
MSMSGEVGGLMLLMPSGDGVLPLEPPLLATLDPKALAMSLLLGSFAPAPLLPTLELAPPVSVLLFVSRIELPSPAAALTMADNHLSNSHALPPVSPTTSSLTKLSCSFSDTTDLSELGVTARLE